jgi:hypothetical protein
MAMTAVPMQCDVTPDGGAKRGQSSAAAYVPLNFATGAVYQFDWSTLWFRRMMRDPST